MSGTGVWGQDVVVSLCCSLFLTFFFHCCFLLTNFLYSTMVSLWATISFSVVAAPTPLPLQSSHSLVSLLVLFPPCPLWCPLPGLSSPMQHFLPCPQYVFTEATNMPGGLCFGTWWVHSRACWNWLGPAQDSPDLPPPQECSFMSRRSGEHRRPEH